MNSPQSTQPGYPTQGSYQGTVQGIKSPPRSKGHDAVLNAIQNQERAVVVILMSGEELTGKIVGRDKYTITVRDDQGRRQVIYKHGIERFYAEEQATKGV